MSAGGFVRRGLYSGVMSAGGFVRRGLCPRFDMIIVKEDGLKSQCC